MNDDGAIERYALRYRDRRTGKWVRVRYGVTREKFVARGAETEVLGPPKMTLPAGGQFNPRRHGEVGQESA